MESYTWERNKHGCLPISTYQLSDVVHRSLPHRLQSAEQEHIKVCYARNHAGDN